MNVSAFVAPQPGRALARSCPPTAAARDPRYSTADRFADLEVIDFADGTPDFRVCAQKAAPATNPTSGTARIAAHTPPRRRRAQSLEKTASRDLLRRGRGPLARLSIGYRLFSFMANFADPSSQRGDEKADAGEKDDPRGDQAPENQGRSHRQSGGEIGGARKTLVRERLPACMSCRRFVVHYIFSAAGLAGCANQRAIWAKIAVK